MIAARQIAFGRGAAKGYTAKDYVQDGLVAMWDGIENAGWGEHDNTATVWKDLSGNGHDAVKVGSPVWESNAGVTDGAKNTFLSTIPNSPAFIEAIKSNAGFTVEVCFAPTVAWGSKSPFSIEDSDGTSSKYRLMQLFSNSSQYYNSGVLDVDGTEFFGKTPTVDNNIGTYSMVVAQDASSVRIDQYWNGVKGTEGGFTIPRYKKFSISEIDALGVEKWYVRIGKTHNNSMSSNFYSVRIHSRAFSAEEIAYNCSIDKARFGL